MLSPLADRLRPTELDQMVGQRHLIGEGKLLRNIIESGRIPNMIFYGPSGVGKTTLARIIAKRSGMKLFMLNGTTASTADIRAAIDSTSGLEAAGGILLYLDEIQYFTKKQQQTLLEHIENGSITLIASTTENPYFYVYGALLSRSSVFEFKKVTAEDILPAVKRAFDALGEEYGKAEIDEAALLRLSEACGGDVRKAVNAAESCVLGTLPDSDGVRHITSDIARQALESNSLGYDRAGDGHYDTISAFQKSMRGSDPDAAVFYLAKLLEAGELPIACRRLLVCASEDVGLADPSVLPIVKAAVDTALMVGLPEARIPLADAVILVALSPKSNSAYNAIASAWADVEAGRGSTVPRQLQNKHFDGDDAAEKGQNYLYPHDYPGHYVAQQYLPDDLRERKYFVFGDSKKELAYKEYHRLRRRQGEKK